MATTYLIDSNILVYAYDVDSPYHKNAKKLVDEDVLAGKINGCIAYQTLYEFYAIITDSKRVSISLKPARAIEIIEVCQKAVNIKKIFPLNTTLNTTLDLLKKYQISRQNIFDVVLVATMLNNGVQGIYTANEVHFKPFEFLEVINPLKEIKEVKLED